MAYLYTAAGNITDAAQVDLFSDVVFVDLESGAYQAKSVDLSGVKAWILANLGQSPRSSSIGFLGYESTQGPVWADNGFYFVVDVNPKPSVPASAGYRVLNPTDQQQLGYALGLDATGLYFVLDSNSGSMIRIGFDGVVATASIGTPFTRNPLGCPLLWRDGTKFRAFGQVGTDFSSSQRGATGEFSVPGNGSGLDGARSASGVGQNRGTLFAGYFYGYQPLAGNDTTTQGQGFISAENQSSTSCDLKAVATTYDGQNLMQVFLQTSLVRDSGGGFFLSGVEVGTVFDMEKLVIEQFVREGRSYQFGGFGGVQVQGLLGALPPWEPDAPGQPVQFWTNVVQAVESV